MLPLALVSPVAAIPYASWKLIHMFSGMAQADSPTGGMRLVLDAAASLWRLQRLAWGGFAASCAVGVLVGLIRHAGSSDDVRCSVRRGAVLLLIPILGLLAAGGLAWFCAAQGRAQSAAATTAIAANVFLLVMDRIPFVLVVVSGRRR